MYKKIGFVFCILVGLGLVLYPTVQNIMVKQQQQQIMTYLQNNKSLEQKEKVEDETSEEQDKEEPTEFKSSHSENIDEVGQANIEADKNPLANIPVEDVLGSIEIPVIDLNLPLFTKVTDPYLNIGPCKFEDTPKLGSEGNIVIAGHRNYRKGDQFNRLNELQKNNSIILYKGDEEFIYRVEESFIVEADALWVMDNIEDEEVLTLITCHPIHTGEKRLIVRCKRYTS